jgi:hypothetical protein
MKTIVHTVITIAALLGEGYLFNLALAKSNYTSKPSIARIHAEVRLAKHNLKIR